MKLGTFIPLILLLTGCGNLTRSDYQRPLLSVPENWQRTEGQNIAPSQVESGRWWDRFGDERLSRVIGQVLESNNDLAAAALTLKQARISAGLTQTNISPDATLNGSGSNSKPLNSGRSQESYSTSLSLSYELDLWASWRVFANKVSGKRLPASRIITRRSCRRLIPPRSSTGTSPC